MSFLRNLVITTAGPLPDQYTPENLSKWTKLYKGQFTAVFNDKVTHILCTREQFNKRIGPTLKNKKIQILHYDWYIETLFYKKRRPPAEFCMRSVLALKREKRKKEELRQKGALDYQRGAINTTMYHVYTDQHFFPYQIDLTRDSTTGEKGQRYTLTLWESNAQPHLYWFLAKFLRKSGDSQPGFHRPSDCSGLFDIELDHFKAFFKAKTGVDWKDRVVKEGTTPDTFFQYAYPKGGKPVGMGLRFSYDYCLELNAQLLGNNSIVVETEKPEDTHASDSEEAHAPDTSI